MTTTQRPFRLEAFCGVQQPQNAKVDHWEMARRTMCILSILYPTRSNDYRNPPQLSVNRSIGQSGSLYKYCSCCGTSHLSTRIGVGCNVTLLLLLSSICNQRHHQTRPLTRFLPNRLDQATDMINHPIHVVINVGYHKHVVKVAYLGA